MRRIVVASILLVSIVAAVQVTITWDQWPYGKRYIGSYFKWWMSADGSHVPVPPFNADDTIWDLVDLGGSQVNRNAEAYIMPRDSARGTPPSLCTYAEKQVFGGQTSWGYEHMDTTGPSQYMWLYGFYAQGTQINYDPPYQRVYKFPMQLGDEWHEEWTWNYMGMDEVTETRDNYIVAQGWVRVPADTMRYYPCLVLRTYTRTIDELGLINEQRVVHEWLVPDMGNVGGSVATIQSQNGVTNPEFTDAEHVFKQKLFRSVFDNAPPTFTNTTQLPSGYNLGPFYILSRITDPSGISADSLYYRIGNGAWQVVTHDSMRNNNYSFHIPALSGTDSVFYYLAARDNAPTRNRGTDPAGGASAPYRFWARDPADDHTPPVITNTTQYGDTAFLGPFMVSTNVTDSCSVDSVMLGYRFNTAPEQWLLPDSIRAANYYFTIPAAQLNTFIRYRIRAVDGSPNRNTSYDPSSGFYSFNVIDAAGPQFAGTTVWNDTSWGGPFPVQSRITDVSGILLSRIFFKLGSASWDSLLADSTRDSIHYFHIPQVTTPMSIRYYLKAIDNSQRRNSATDPRNAPTENYVFFSEGVGALSEKELSSTVVLNNIPSVNPTTVRLMLCNETHLEVAIYDVQGNRLALLPYGNRPAGVWQFSLPDKLPAGSYFLVMRADDQWLRHKFVITH